MSALVLSACKLLVSHGAVWQAAARRGGASLRGPPHPASLQEELGGDEICRAVSSAPRSEDKQEGTSLLPPPGGAYEEQLGFDLMF